MSELSEARPTRRDVLKQSAMVTAASAFASTALVAPAASVSNSSGSESSGSKSSGLNMDPGTPADNLFTKMGVRPIINARGTFTIITGSRSLPQVKQAMYAASFYFVQLDELMSAVGREIATLMGADSAIVTTGCEAAIALATVACCCGTDPELSQIFPYRKRRSKVLIPSHSRNQYDFGIRMTGVELIEVHSAEELHERLTDEVAMIYVLSSPAAETGPLSIEAICRYARTKSVPVFVDAAAEEPLSPNIHIRRGATLVGYSGGKCMRGPQSAGVLLGQADLVKAAWFQAAPHHNYGRAFKVGKEEIMGMLAAVQQWYERDHEAEQKRWRTWLETIAGEVRTLPSVTTEYKEPLDLSNHAPTLVISWDANTLGVTGTEVAARLDAGTPRIMVGDATGVRPEQMKSSVSVMPYMMEADEVATVAEVLARELKRPEPRGVVAVDTAEPVDMAGDWTVSLQFSRGSSEQVWRVEQRGVMLSGSQIGEIYEADLHGSVHADQIRMNSTMKLGGNWIQWHFAGKSSGRTASGTVDMAEYGKASWTAVRSG